MGSLSPFTQIRKGTVKLATTSCFLVFSILYSSKGDSARKQVHVISPLTLLQGRPKIRNEMYMKYTVNTFIIYNTTLITGCI
jgi:hypothetical protein